MNRLAATIAIPRATVMTRIAGLDLLRALAIIWVMLFHSFLVGGLGPGFEWLSRYGWAGVDMFFVLSGFLIGTQVLRPLSRGENVSIRAFYARRAWRILPAFVVVLALYVCFPTLREEPGLQPWWQFATFTMNLLIDYSRNQAFSQAWSLCVEEHFYLVFPVLAAGMAARPSATRLALVCLGVVLAGLTLRGTVWLHDSAVGPARNWFIEDLYYPSWMRLDGLLVGVVLSVVRVYRPMIWSRMQDRSNVCLGAGLVASCLAFWLFRDRTGLLANTIGWPVLSLAFGLLVVAASSPRGLMGRCRMPGAAFIAAISYSLYLSRKMVFHWVADRIAPSMQDQGGLLFGIYALATLLIGTLLHHMVERPFLHWRDQRDERRRTRGDGAKPSSTSTMHGLARAQGHPPIGAPATRKTGPPRPASADR